MPIVLHQGIPAWDQIQTGKKKLMFVGYGYDVISGEKVNGGINCHAECGISFVENRRIEFDVAGRSTCKGDSGRPALLLANGIPVQVDITSIGTEDCKQGYETRVDAYDAWLKGRIR